MPVLGSTSAAASAARYAWNGLVLEQSGRAILWLPFAVMVGAGAYFAWPEEPAWWSGAMLAALSVFGCVFAGSLPSGSPRDLRRRIAVVTASCLAALAAAAAGFAIAQARTIGLRAPQLEIRPDPVRLNGWVVEAAMGAARPRLKILVRAIEGTKSLPRYVEISTTNAGAIQPGRAVECLAVLRLPEGALAPGAYDQAFNAYFERVGATGFSYGACRPGLFGPPPAAIDALALQVAAIRRAVTETIAESAPGRGGAVAAALVTGDLSLIDPETTRAFRDSGLGHMLSVSGLHMGLVSGLVYAALHLLLALIPPLALRFPIRKWAALGALVTTGSYLVLSGASVPAQRSFVLIAVALGAVLVDRPAITMRGLAVAALVVTLLSPEAVVTPGFQMSFAASAALVAAFEDHGRRRADQPVAAPGLLIGTLQRGWDWLFGALLASAVAGLASDPFALMHFQRITLYALPSNLVATPVTSLLIAPAAIAGAILTPLGWAEPAWQIMAAGLDFLIASAEVFADRPEAVRYLPQPPVLAFGVCVLAIAWGCLWRGLLRWASIGLFASGVILYAAAPRPVLWIDGRGEATLARASGDLWVLLASRGSTFERERLGQLAGLGPMQIRNLAEPESCGAALCAWRSPAQRSYFLVREPRGLATACTPDAVVIAAYQPTAQEGANCRASILITPGDLALRGGAAITEANGSAHIQYARRPIRRAWTF